MGRMTRKTQPAEAPLTELEKIRARTMMRNNRVFQSLGISRIASMIRNSNGSAIIADDSSASAITQGESSDYNPRDEDIIEEEVDDTVVDKIVKVPRRRKKCAKRKRNSTRSPDTTTTMAPGRVFAVPPGGSDKLMCLDEHATARVTRQKAKVVDVANEGGLLRKDGGSSMQWDDGSMSMDEGSTVRMDLSPVAPTVDRNDEFDSAPEQPMGDEGTSLVVVSRKRKGTGLEKMTKGLGSKVRIEIAEGMKRPERPVLAAKFASEGGMIARSHTPILPHFKEYKKDKAMVKDYIGKVAANFEMDTDAQEVKVACTDILKNVSKQRRHLVKKKFFDQVPATELSIKSPVSYISDEEWQALLKLWTNPKHMDTCQKNRTNRGLVKFQQKTGSRCYLAHLYAAREERQGEELNAIDMFKVTHNSKKAGFSVAVQDAIRKMEAEMAKPVPEGEQPKSAVEVVAQVLTNEAPSSTFLKNVSLQTGSKNKMKSSHAAVSAHVRDLQEKLQKSEQRSEEMSEELAAIKKAAQEAEAAQAQRDKEYQVLVKRAQEHEEKLAHMMALFGAKMT